MTNRLYVDVATNDKWLFGREFEEDQQPDMVRLSWFLERDDGTPLGDACHLIRLPPGRRMNPDAAIYTGIHDRHLVPGPHSWAQFEVMTEFLEEGLGQCSRIIAFSWEFHRRVLEKELRRPDENNQDRMFEVSAQGIKQVGRQHLPVWPPAIDVMTTLAPLLKIENRGRAGYKLPSFQEASDKITGNNPPSSPEPIRNGQVRIARLMAFYQYIENAKA